MPEKILPQNPCKSIFMNDVEGGGVEEGIRGLIFARDVFVLKEVGMYKNATHNQPTINTNLRHSNMK